MRMAQRNGASATPGGSEAEWQRARDHLSRSAAVWQELREKNTRIPADIPKAEQVKHDLSACEAALAPSGG